MKTYERHEVLALLERIMKIMKIQKLSLNNYENHEKIKITQDYYENLFIFLNPTRESRKS